MSTMSLASLKVNKCKVSPSMIWGETHTASVMTCKIKMCQFCNLFDFFFYMMDCHYYTLVYSNCRSHLCCFQYKSQILRQLFAIKLLECFYCFYLAEHFRKFLSLLRVLPCQCNTLVTRYISIHVDICSNSAVN